VLIRNNAPVFGADGSAYPQPGAWQLNISARNLVSNDHYNGTVEQVASPREIYARPATAYTAQFIGQTNVLRGEIRGSIATCGALRWPLEETDGSAIFSLRPEAIRLSADGKRGASEVKFRAAIRQQLYGGTSELLEVDCGNGQTLRVRIPACGPLTGEHDFVFSISDAIRVQE
jgi:ABC-type Fe3+/spermidine/putrescine transport system ATPase subunit